MIPPTLLFASCLRKPLQHSNSPHIIVKLIRFTHLWRCCILSMSIGGARPTSSLLSGLALILHENLTPSRSSTSPRLIRAFTTSMLTPVSSLPRWLQLDCLSTFQVISRLPLTVRRSQPHLAKHMECDIGLTE